MGCGKMLCVVLVALVAVFVGRYYFLISINEGIADQRTTRLIQGSIVLTGDLAMAAYMTGIGSPVNTTRKLYDIIEYWSPDEPSLKIEDTKFSGVPVRVYTPKNLDAKSPAFIFFHGGGWSMGSIGSHDVITRAMAKRLNIVVVSVGYRMAPEHAYPIPLEDCVAVTLHMLQKSAEYGVDGSRIAIGGDSAGGNLATAVTLKIRAMNFKPVPKIQMLIYPLVQAVDLDLPSYRMKDLPIITPVATAACVAAYSGKGVSSRIPDILNNQHTTPQTKKAITQYLNLDYLPDSFKEGYTRKAPDSGDSALAEELKFVLDPYVSPLLAKSLKGLPEAYVLTAHYDILRDEGVMYAKRLQKDGVKVTWKHYDTGFHGMMNFIGKPHSHSVGVKAMDDLLGYLKENL